MEINYIPNIKFLIVAGTGKSATTSLYHYLADHPQVCASSVKEIRFFLDIDYPSQRVCDYRKGLEQYLKCFPCNKNQIHLDVSPQYLYSTGTPKRIRESLENVKIIFLLRKPIDRLLSWYYFDIQTGEISQDISLSSYVKLQIDQKDRHLQRKTLEQGNYTKYLKKYYEVFKKENIRVYFFEEFKTNPLPIIRNICKLCKINADFYDTYNFKIHNQTKNMRSIKVNKIIVNLRENIYKKTINKHFINNILKKSWSVTKPLYFALNTKKNKNKHIQSNLKRMLDDYYKNESKELTDLIGKNVPW